MKSIFILDEYVSSTRNGIGVFVREFTHCLEQLQIIVCRVVFNSDYHEVTSLEVDGEKIIYFPRFPSGSFLSHWNVINRFFRLYIQDSNDNIFCFNHSPCPELQLSIKKSHPLSKQVYIIHDLGWTFPLLGNYGELIDLINCPKEYPKYQKRKWLLDVFDKEKQMCDIADAVVCLMEGTCKVLVDIYQIKKEKIHFIPNGLRAENRYIPLKSKTDIRREKHIGADEKIILFVGRMSEPKGACALMDAFRLVLGKDENARLVLAGGISPNFSLSAYGDIASRVTYLGFTDHVELEEWYSIANIGVMPSYSEQCSFVGIEMMMSGLPIVASDGFGVCEMFHNEINAVVAPIGDRNDPIQYVNHLSDALLMVLLSEDICKRLANGSREYYHSHYSIANMQENYRRLLCSI